jgi:hypothetical protein
LETGFVHQMFGNMHPTRIFKAPEELLQAWEKYKESLNIEARKWPRVQYVGKDGERVEDYPKLPLTMEGFSVWCYKENIGTIRHYFSNTEGLYDDFCHICSHVREEIRHDQITGGLLGNYNPSITQRLNGLTDKSEVTVREQPLFGE